MAGGMDPLLDDSVDFSTRHAHITHHTPHTTHHASHFDSRPTPCWTPLTTFSTLTMNVCVGYQAEAGGSSNNPRDREASASRLHRHDQFVARRVEAIRTCRSVPCERIRGPRTSGLSQIVDSQGSRDKELAGAKSFQRRATKVPMPCL